MTWKHGLAVLSLCCAFFNLLYEILQPFPRIWVVFLAIFVGVMSAMYLWDVPYDDEEDNYA